MPPDTGWAARRARRSQGRLFRLTAIKRRPSSRVVLVLANLADARRFHRLSEEVVALAATLADAFGSDLQTPLPLRFEQVENVLKTHAVADQLVLELSVFHAGFGRDVGVLVLFQNPERLFDRSDLLRLKAKILLIDDVLQSLRVFLHLNTPLLPVRRAVRRNAGRTALCNSLLLRSWNNAHLPASR